MSEDNTLTLPSPHHDKIGIIHCGVTCEGRIAVAGDPCDLADGEEFFFEKVHIRAKRQGSEYIFTKET